MHRSIAITPLGALWRGAVAGAAGSAAMNAWFAAAGKWMPAPREGAFVPADEKQKSETPTETIARRFAADFMRREEPAPPKKATAGQLVHFAFGATWGALYGLTAETFPALRSPAGAIAAGSFVWAASDHLLLPAFRLAPWPNGVTAKGHAFWFATHMVYGSALGVTYALVRPASFAGVALSALSRRLFARTSPRLIRRARNAVERVGGRPLAF